MSKNDRLGPMVRAMVGVDVEYHGVLADIINRLNSRDGLAWSGLYAGVSMAGLPKGKPTAPPPLFSIVATIQLGAVAGKKTSKCFIGSRWTYRDGDCDRWLPADQPQADACAISTLKPSRDWTFAEAASSILGVGAGTNTVLLGKLLIEHGHTMTLAQAENMVGRTESGEATGMRTDGWGNFLFVETGDEKDPVSVLCVDRDVGRWVARVGRLDDDFGWRAGHRLLLRNSAALTL